MSGDAAAVSAAVYHQLQAWKDGGRLQCLQQLAQLTVQPDGEDDIRIFLQSLVNALVTTDDCRIAPDDLASLYGDLVLSQPSSSASPGHLAIHQILLDCVSIIDDKLEDHAMAREALTKEKEKADAPREQKDVKEKPKHRIIPERQPLVDFIRRLITNNTLPQELCALNLDYGLLQDVGVIRDSVVIGGKEVRARTKLIYRQTKVNLLREQSEGYSKFIIELSHSLGPSQDAISLEWSQHALIATSQQTVDRLMKVAGYFDLDPTRMLDLVLDVFSTHIMTHYSYFIELVRQFVSTRTRLLGGESIVNKLEKMQLDTRRKYAGIDFESILKAAEGEVRSLPSTPDLRNPLAQLLGFKFAHYESNAQNVPQNLVFTAALLIREGLVSIYDVYDHLSPNEQGLEGLRTKHEEEMKKRIRLARTTAADKDNALASAGVLSQADDREYSSRRPPPPPQPTAAPVKPIKEPKILDELNQHRDLTIALLSVGALRPALFILTKHPWLISRYPQIADIMLKHLEYSIDPVYQAFSPAKQDPDAAAVYNTAMKHPENTKSSKIKSTMIFPVPPPTSETEQAFFFPSWSERIPVCSSMEDLQSVVNPFLKIIGIHAYRSLPLYLKLCRIARHQFNAEASEETKKFWIDMIRVHFLPLVSMSKDNSSLGMELWPILQQLERPQRWGIYAEWLQRTYDLNSEMRLKKALVTRECKGVLRRLSSKNQGQSARAFAKIAHHNPCIIFTVAIDQVMSYDNLADPLIEALRTLSPIGYDILTFCLLVAFGDPNKPRMKDDGTNVAHWLQSLASLTAHLCRRYGAIDPTPILQFVVHRLYADSPPDAIILRELISKMSGIEPLQLLADNQVAAMGGGPILQIETVASESRGALQTKPLQRSSDKLLTVLSTADLILPMLLLLARQGQACVYQSDVSEAILKGLSSMFDDLRGIFFQYITFISLSPVSQKPASSKIRSDFFENFPSLADIVRDYGIEPTMVIHMCRAPMQRAIVEQAIAENKASKATPAAKEESLAETEARLKAQMTATKDNGTEDALMQIDSDLQKPWLPILQPWIDAVAEVLPPHVLSVMGAPFFVTFWQLTLFETVSLVTHYKDHTTRLTKLADDHARSDPGQIKSSRERLAWSDKKERLNTFKEQLVKESSDHLIIYSATKKRLAQERMHWFNGDERTARELPDHIIQYCLFPRALLSPMDADFAAQFIKILHNLGTKGFWTLGCYNKLFGEQLGAIIFACTQNEAKNFGRFLRGVLRDLAVWSKDEAQFTADCRKGSAFSPGLTAKAVNYPPSEKDMMDWSSFKRFVKKVHQKLCSVLTACLTGSNGEYMHISNAIFILKEILPVFPLGAIHNSTGQFLDQALQQLLATEKRGDIKILATSYQGQLRMAKKEWTVPSVPTSDASETKPSARTNGTASAPVGPKGVPAAPPSAPAAARAPRQPGAANSPLSHPLPANPARTRPADGASEVKAVSRPPVIKRIDRDAPNPRENDEPHSAPSADPADKSQTARLQATESLDGTGRQSPRPTNGQPLLPLKEIPLGPRNPAQRGHRLSEDPSSRPPPSASMPPPRGPSTTAVSQELRAAASQQQDRIRPSGSDRDTSDSRPRVDSSRSGDSSRADSRKRSASPGRPGTDGRRENERGADRRSSRDEYRSERRSTREEERERDRDKDRRSDRDRDGRRERESSTRGTTSRTDDPSRTSGSPHRADDTSRKRARDPREGDPSDRESKRPTRDRDREKDRDRRDRSTRDKDYRHRERRHDKDDASPATGSPRDADRESKTGPLSTPSAPRAMIRDEDKRFLVTAASDAVRRERETTDAPSSRSHSSYVGPPPGSSRGTRREHREERSSDSMPPPSSSLASRIAGDSLPPRPASGLRESTDRMDREGARKRTVSARSQDELASNASSSKRVKLDRTLK